MTEKIFDANFLKYSQGWRKHLIWTKKYSTMFEAVVTVLWNKIECDYFLQIFFFFWPKYFQLSPQGQEHCDSVTTWLTAKAKGYFRISVFLKNAWKELMVSAGESWNVTLWYEIAYGAQWEPFVLYQWKYSWSCALSTGFPPPTPPSWMQFGVFFLPLSWETVLEKQE